MTTTVDDDYRRKKGGQTNALSRFHWALNFLSPGMAIVLTGTFCVGWSRNIVDILRTEGIEAYGDECSDNDPFALLLRRAKALRQPGKDVVGAPVVVVASPTDVNPKHPMVDALLRDLARAIMPEISTVSTIVIRADPHEYFAKCIGDGYHGNAAELSDVWCPDYLGIGHWSPSSTGSHWFTGHWSTGHRGWPAGSSNHISAPPHVADTPELLKRMVMSALQQRGAGISKDT